MSEDAVPPVRIFLWTGGFVLVGSGLESTPHAHQALQLAVGLDGATRLRLDGAWREAPALLVDTDVEHGFDGRSGRHATLWIDPETTAAARLREEVLDGCRWAQLPEDRAELVVEQLRPLLAAEAGCEEAVGCYAGTLRRLIGEATPGDGAVDGRLVPVLDRLRLLDVPTPPVAELARLATLSPSRLQHLFTEQLGMPIRRYALWQRLLRAGRLMSDGMSATRAAHTAGFADSAHLSREWRRMIGQSPTGLELSRLVTICDEVRA